MPTDKLTNDLQRMDSNFDFSNLPGCHMLFDATNKSKLFRFKEELGI